MICRTAVEFICRAVDARLAVGDRLALVVHIFFCSACRRFRAEVRQLHDLYEAGEAVAPTAGTLSPEGRERIAAGLEQQPPPP